IKSKLQEIEDNGFLGESVRFTLSPFFSIKVCKRNVKDGSGFLLTSIIDLDSNYCDQEVMLRSVVFCHNTKKNKIKPFLERYKEWWLVLSDTITYDGSVEYREYLASNLCKTPFSRIIFVNSLNGDIVLEI
ncbi:hypothetical protein, partial [Marinomonas spartinae]|uniref:hypothetical protein n=1 Tax=Marinomonas spartinae TaxID=1792290 RepID=UPI0018F20004